MFRLTTGENVGKLKAEREADMAIIEFEGFDAKTTKALKKKVANAFADTMDTSAFDTAITDVTVGQKLEVFETVEFLTRIRVAISWLEDIDPHFPLHEEAQRIVDMVGERPSAAFLGLLDRMILDTVQNA
jgi:hypothetical protein